MSEWRQLRYGDREFSLVPAAMKASSWMRNELTLPLAEALEAIEHFRHAGVETVAWENLHGYPDRKVGGGFNIEGEHRIYRHSPDYGIAEAAAAMQEQNEELRSLLEPHGECLLFCLMIMDEA